MDFQSRIDEGGVHGPKKNGHSKESREAAEGEMKPSAGPTVLFYWVWNWLVSLPKTVTNLFAELKSGEFLARFTLLDAMLQFIVAVATSCHPQEDTSGDTEDFKSSTDSSKTKKDINVFGGTGKTLRSRIIETAS